MTQSEIEAEKSAPVDEVQQDWNDLKLRVEQLEADLGTVEQENKHLRALLERTIEHRQRSHSELVNFLADLVSKLPLNDIGVMVSRLVEHNEHVCEVCAAMIKGKVEASVTQPKLIRAMEQTKRDLTEALRTAVDEMVKLDTPLEASMLQGFVSDPESYFAPPAVRANRCFVKGQVPRERIVREFGEEALIFFDDLTTDSKRNPRPKPDEIVLSFKSDFETLFEHSKEVIPDKRDALRNLYEKVQRSKGQSDEVCRQKRVFARLSFILELLHYYANQSTEAPNVVFAQRMPALVEQLALVGCGDHLDEKLIGETETALGWIINPDHRQMTVNNVGKSGGTARTLRFVLAFRSEDVLERDLLLAQFVKHLIPAPPQSPPAVAELAAVLRLIHPEMQRMVVKSIMSTDRLRKDAAKELGKAIGKELGLEGLEVEMKSASEMPPEMERRMAWGRIKDLFGHRSDPAAIAAAFRERLHAKYDSDELKQSWLTLIEADAIAFIRTFSQLPYLPDGRTDSIARPVMESYVTRLTHQKYASTYTKVVNSLKNMAKANPNSPTLVNFLALVKWVDAESAEKISRDVGMHATAH